MVSPSTLLAIDNCVFLQLNVNVTNGAAKLRSQEDE